MRKTDLWPQVEQLLRHVERPSRYIDHEWGVCIPDSHEFGFCMVYPDTYELGQANQALRILVNVVNATDGLVAERAFLPAVDMIDAMREQGIPLFSLESCAPLREFDVVGITLPHELAATNVLEVLDLAQIPLFASERTEDDPIVIGGGPCVYDPEPYAPFFDVLTIGEGEEATPETLLKIKELRNAGLSRAALLEELSHIPGTYVPSLYEVLAEEEAQEQGSWVRPLKDDIPSMIEKRIYEGFATSEAWEPMIVPYSEVVHDRLNVEVLRGCARGCRFCQAGMMYRPVRERSVEAIVSATLQGLDETGYEEVSLTSLSTTDHSGIAEILQRLDSACAGRGIRISIPSQRLDSFGVGMAELVAGQKKGGLTFAPEAGSQRMRDVINKNVSEDDLLVAVEAAMNAGWRRVKLYFMVGLPAETDEDVCEIGHLAQRAFDRMKAVVAPEERGKLKMSISLALFVPKSQTPFQWDGQIAPEEAKRRVSLVKAAVRSRAINVSYHDPQTSFVEAVMSRGGREVAALVHEAWKRGARFDAWTEHFNEEAWRSAAKELDIDMDAIAQKTFDKEYVLPWSHISTGVSIEFLRAERHRAAMAQSTPDCTFAGCTQCGACPALGVSNQLVGIRTAGGDVNV